MDPCFEASSEEMGIWAQVLPDGAGKIRICNLTCSVELGNVTYLGNVAQSIINCGEMGIWAQLGIDGAGKSEFVT